MPALLRRPDVELVAVCNSSYASADQFCRENAPHATPMQNWAELLGLPDLDIVWIGTPPTNAEQTSVPPLVENSQVPRPSCS